MVCAGAIASGIAALVLALPLGSRNGLRAFLDYYAGVGALLSLTATVVWGLASTDTRVLGPRQRLLAQGVHRVATAASVGFLALHIMVKLAERHTTLMEGLIPYDLRGHALLIGLGTAAGYLLVLAAVTGALRGAFAARGRPVRWRVLHACAYPAWFTAVVHGLTAGRAAAGWVVASYAACLVAVGAALALRLARRGKQAETAPRPRGLPVVAAPVRGRIDRRMENLR